MIPGEIKTDAGNREMNVGRQPLIITVANAGDRPIQVGSHYHFYEVNPALHFDRQSALGYRLDITSGTAIRFEPGQTRKVILIPFRGKRRVFGFRAEVQGSIEAHIGEKK